MPKQPPEYWKQVCMDNGVDVSGLGRQDIEVKALRSLGFSGTLNDMRREFYQARRGDSFLSDAIAKNNQWNVG